LIRVDLCSVIIKRMWGGGSALLFTKGAAALGALKLLGVPGQGW
jgi:hypothetical protein